MSAIISAPVKWVESVSALRLPRKADRRLQKLMDRHNDGQLSAQEREELESLVDLSEKLSLVRTKRFASWGRLPDEAPDCAGDASRRPRRRALRVLPDASIASRGHVSP